MHNVVVLVIFAGFYFEDIIWYQAGIRFKTNKETNVSITVFRKPRVSPATERPQIKGLAIRLVLVAHGSRICESSFPLKFAPPCVETISSL